MRFSRQLHKTIPRNPWTAGLLLSLFLGTGTVHATALPDGLDIKPWTPTHQPTTSTASTSIGGGMNLNAVMASPTGSATPAFSPMGNQYTAYAVTQPTSTTLYGSVTHHWGALAGLGAAGGPRPTFPYNAQAGDYYSLLGENPPVWEQFPVKIYLDYPEPFASNAKAQVQAALAAWKNYIPFEITRERAMAHIRIQWDGRLDGKAFGETVVKKTETGADGKPKLRQVEIRMLLPEKYGSLPETALKAAMMHELGHAFGIGKDSDVVDDVMCRPNFRNRNPFPVKQLMSSLALKGLELALSSQGIQWSAGKNTFKAASGTSAATVVDALSPRDLNTLYKLYTPSTTALGTASFVQ
jgi:predicted Zn-dependent protease